MKKFLKIFAISIVTIFALLLGIPYLFKDKIKAAVKAEVDKRLNAKVSFEDLSLSLIRNFPNMSVGLEGFRVIGKGHFSKDTLVSVENCRAVVDIKSVWEGKNYQVNKIILDKPKVNAIIDEHGNANWDIMVSDTTKQEIKDTKVTEFKINLNEYRINEGDISYHDA
ncbi:MAG: AsmA family protein, partial [Bacteroidia bacterium]